MELIFEYKGIKFFETDHIKDKDALINIGRKLSNALSSEVALSSYGEKGKIIIIHDEKNQLVGNTYLNNSKNKFEFILEKKNKPISDKKILIAFNKLHEKMNLTKEDFCMCLNHWNKNQYNIADITELLKE